MVAFAEPQLVNAPFGDPGLYVDLRFARRALLFDLGDLEPLSSRKLLRVSDAFVSHTHLDHFNGFDRLLRVCLGRPAALRLLGPPGFIAQVGHKLAAYTWNLVASNENDFVVAAAEFDGRKISAAAEFHTRDAFLRREVTLPDLPPGVLMEEDAFQIRGALLDHGIPSLAFAFVEKLRVNVWKDRLEKMGLAVGPWLKEAKEAVRRGAPDDTLIAALRQGRPREPATVSLRELKSEAFRIAPGQSFAYVVDASYHEQNAARVVALARDADTLFIEAVFLQEDKEIAASKHHLTAVQAGALARRAGARRVVPFHFSPRYREREELLRRQVQDAFTGVVDATAVQLSPTRPALDVDQGGRRPAAQTFRQGAAPMTMRLISTAFTSSSSIPRLYTGDGADISPPLSWAGAPAETRSFALICSDPDAPAGVWYHWAAYDIPAATKSLPEHCPADASGFAQARNSFGKRGYGGPFPPRGHGRHHYHFKLFALDVERLDLGPSASCRDVEEEAGAHAIATAELVGVYSR